MNTNPEYDELARHLCHDKTEITIQDAKYHLAQCLLISDSANVNGAMLLGSIIDILCANVEAGNDIQIYRQAMQELEDECLTRANSK